MSKPFVDTWHDRTDVKKQEAARAMLAALKELVTIIDLQADEMSNANIAFVPEHEAAHAAIAQAEAAGITLRGQEAKVDNG